MAKTNFNIASAIRGEIKTPAAEPIVKAEEKKLTEPPKKPAEPVLEAEGVCEPVFAPSTPEKTAKKRGRPKKTEEREAFVKATVPTSLKKKLQIICKQRNVSENDYTYELLKKAVARDYEQCLAEMLNSIN